MQQTNTILLNKLNECLNAQQMQNNDVCRALFLDRKSKSIAKQEAARLQNEGLESNQELKRVQEQYARESSTTAYYIELEKQTFCIPYYAKEVDDCPFWSMFNCVRDVKKYDCSELNRVKKQRADQVNALEKTLTNLRTLESKNNDISVKKLNMQKIINKMNELKETAVDDANVAPDINTMYPPQDDVIAFEF